MKTTAPLLRALASRAVLAVARDGRTLEDALRGAERGDGQRPAVWSLAFGTGTGLISSHWPLPRPARRRGAWPRSASRVTIWAVRRYTLVTREGRHIDVIMNASRITYAGEPALLVIVTDVTQLTNQAERLKESEEKFRLLAEQTLVGVGVIQDGIIAHANQAFCDLTGFSFEELHSWPSLDFGQFIHPDDRALIMEEYRKKEAGDSTARPRYVFRVIRKDSTVM